MKWPRLSALLILITVPSVVQAGSFDLGPADRVVLNGYARDTWRSFDALVQPSGLPADLLSKTAKGWTTVKLYVALGYRRLPLEHPGGGRPEDHRSTRGHGPDRPDLGRRREARTLARILL